MSMTSMNGSNRDSSSLAPVPTKFSSDRSSTAKTLEYFHLLEKLKVNKRTGWVNQNVKLPESIADHMYRMAMMAMTLPEHGEKPLDIGKMVMLSLVHDMAEAEVGDITPEDISGITREEKLNLEQAAMERIEVMLGKGTPESNRVLSLWREYEDRQTPESQVVKDLDLFELAVQGVEYEASNGLQNIQRFFETTVPRIKHPTVKEWAHDLMEERRAAWGNRGWPNYVHVDVAGLETRVEEGLPR